MQVEFVVGHTAAREGIPILVVNPEPNVFAELAEGGTGHYLEGTAGEWVPAICEALAAGG